MSLLSLSSSHLVSLLSLSKFLVLVLNIFRRPSISESPWVVDQASGRRQRKIVSNTYRMEPRKDEQFNHKKAEALITKITNNLLSGEKYDKTLSPILARQISTQIKERMKDLVSIPFYLVSCARNM